MHNAQCTITLTSVSVSVVVAGVVSVFFVGVLMSVPKRFALVFRAPLPEVVIFSSAALFVSLLTFQISEFIR